MAYGWNVLRVDRRERRRPARKGLSVSSCRTNDRPTLIIVHSHIGYGAPHKQDSPEAHGEPLGDEEVRLTKEFFGFDPAQASWFLPACANTSRNSSACGVPV